MSDMFSRRSRRKRPAFLLLEPLEGRHTPAGLVSVAFDGQSLAVTGDAAANTLTVVQKTNGALAFYPDQTTALSLNGKAQSAGVPLSLPTPLAGDAVFDLRGGDDWLTLRGAYGTVNLPGSLTVLGGDGDNIVELLEGVHVTRDLSIVNGVGDDSTLLRNAVSVDGAFTIQNGAGGSTLADDASVDLKVGGALSVLSGAGHDAINLTEAKSISAGSVVVNTGADADGSVMRLQPKMTLSLGSVWVVNGDGDDKVVLGAGTPQTQLSGAVTVANGGGDNVTQLVGVSLSVAGPTLVTGGAKGDVLEIEGNVVTLGRVTLLAGDSVNEPNGLSIEANSLHVNGGVFMTAGAGDDDFQVETYADSWVAGPVRALLGPGPGQFGIDDYSATSSLRIGGSLTVASGSPAGGQDRVTLLNVTVQGATSLTTGRGSDSVWIDDCDFKGTFTAATGRGKDAIGIEQDANTVGKGVTVFRRAVRIDAGAGDDSVLIGAPHANAACKAVFRRAVTIGGGAGHDALQTLRADRLAVPAKKVGFETSKVSLGDVI